MPTQLRDVRSQGQSGKHMLALSFSGFDPISDIGIGIRNKREPALGSSTSEHYTMEINCRKFPGHG
jgi:hypothetical protein